MENFRNNDISLFLKFSIYGKLILKLVSYGFLCWIYWQIQRLIKNWYWTSQNCGFGAVAKISQNHDLLTHRLSLSDFQIQQKGRRKSIWWSSLDYKHNTGKNFCCHRNWAQWDRIHDINAELPKRDALSLFNFLVSGGGSTLTFHFFYLFCFGRPLEPISII